MKQQDKDELRRRLKQGLLVFVGTCVTAGLAALNQSQLYEVELNTSKTAGLCFKTAAVAGALWAVHPNAGKSDILTTEVFNASSNSLREAARTAVQCVLEESVRMSDAVHQHANTYDSSSLRTPAPSRYKDMNQVDGLDTVGDDDFMSNAEYASLLEDEIDEEEFQDHLTDPFYEGPPTSNWRT